MTAVSEEIWVGPHSFQDSLDCISGQFVENLAVRESWIHILSLPPGLTTFLRETLDLKQTWPIAYVKLDC